MNPPDLIPGGWQRPGFRLLLALACVALIACQTPGQHEVGQPARTPTAATPVGFDEAISKAASDLLRTTQLPPASGPRQVLLIDPPVDGVTGSQSAATRSMEQKIVDLVRRDHPQLAVQTFNASNLAGQPLVLVGTLTPINDRSGQPGGGARRLPRLPCARRPEDWPGHRQERGPRAAGRGADDAPALRRRQPRMDP